MRTKTKTIFLGDANTIVLFRYNISLEEERTTEPSESHEQMRILVP